MEIKIKIELPGLKEYLKGKGIKDYEKITQIIKEYIESFPVLLKENKKRENIKYTLEKHIELAENFYDIEKFKEAWIKWYNARQKMGKKLTKKAAEMNLIFLDKYRENAVKILYQSISNEWLGLYPLKEKTTNPYMRI